MCAKDYTRSEFLETITHAAIASFGLVSIIPKDISGKILVSEFYPDIPGEAVILFQGDSITDAGRNRETLSPNNQPALGTGYAFLATSDLRHRFPQENVQCYNRGISGDKVFQLADRWDTDCISLQPDILSILVGVNDFWHTLDFDYEGTVKTYDEDYRALLSRTKEKLPEVQLIIGEPFALKAGTAINESWYPEFPKYQEAAKAIAKDFGAAFIPYQSIFDKASERVPAAYWSSDGVHPSMAGSQLMATAWLETLNRL